MRKLILALAMALPSTSLMAAGKVTLNVALNPAGNFQAVSENVTGDVVKKGQTLTSPKLDLNIESLKTGIDLRDEHLWKHLQSKQHATATLYNLKGENGLATADLEVGGVKRPIKIKYKDQAGQISGEFKVKAHDFKLPPAEYMGIGVEDEIVAKVNMPYKTIN